MAIRNKLTVARGEGKWDNGEKKGKGPQGMCIKDPWTKPKGGRIQGGRWGWVGQGTVVAGKWRQRYLNNSKKKKRKKKKNEFLYWS